MPANCHVTPQNAKAPAIVEVNTLSEDDQAINPADHYGVTPDYSIQVNGRNTIYSNEYIESKYMYEMNHCDVDHQAKEVKITPRKYQYNFRTKRQVQRTGVMLVGWGGNNGSTVTGAIIANRDKITWMRKEKVIVLWTANTERYTDVRPGLNTTKEEVLQSIADNDDEISPSNIFACAAILENCPYINGSPQNTLVPGIIELAEKHNVFIGGDDFKSGQTKLKSVLADFLVSAGLKLESIVSYNHLGNNDGKNLSAPQQFRSKEISKSNVVDDMVGANHLLYDKKTNEHPDHVVVIKYVPFVKDSKRAMDEYISSIFMNGINTIAIHNTCEDSLLASPLIIDLVILTELMTRITYSTNDNEEYQTFEAVLSILSYLLKAPLVPSGTPVINALFKQHRCITNIFSACAGIAMDTDMLLEHKTKLPKPMKVQL
ncbi:unnamed protein product [Rotaria socialis]|uniref:inositol-3-phosphate synthase n=1 Tax=Rotaria socialis TaxID=392032 RepID=A0A820Q4D9_9BILA|nr:unnamed protein product [Rotaria socialis]